MISFLARRDFFKRYLHFNWNIMFLMLIPQLAFKLPFCNQINLLCAAVEAFAINYMTTEVFAWVDF